MSEDASWAGYPPGEPIAGKTFRRDGWIRLQVHDKLTPDEWQAFQEAIGEGEFVPFRLTIAVDLLISPQGLENMKAFVEQKRRPS